MVRPHSSPPRCRWFHRRGLRLGTLRRVLLILGLIAPAGMLLPHCVVAQDEPQLVHSAVPPRDRDAELKLHQAGILLEQSQLVPALTLIREVLEAPLGEGTGFIRTQSQPDREVLTGSRAAARQLLARMPGEGHRLYLLQAEPLARMALDNAVTEDDWLSIAVRFAATEAGLEALRLLANWHLDLSNYRQAAAAYRHILRHALLPPADRPFLERRLQTIEDLSRPASATATAPLVRAASLSPTGHPAATDQIAARRLAGALQTPVWQVELPADESLKTALSHALHEASEQSIPSFPMAQPVVSGNVLLARSFGRMTAFDLKTGRPLWKSTGVEESLGAGEPVMEFGSSGTLHRSLIRQVLLDSVFTRCVTDSRLVLSIERPGPRALHLASSQERLVARDLRTGEIVWEFDGRNPDRSQQPEPANARAIRWSFPGVPGLVDRLAVGIAHDGEGQWLYAVDRTDGRRVWQVEAARTQRSSPADADWRVTACPVLEIDGRLICPTAAGMLVTFDLLTREPLWADRYDRADAPPLFQQLPGVSAPLHRRWWEGWREVVWRLVSIRQKPLLLLATPDSRMLKALRADTGELVWQHDCAHPLALSDVQQDRVLLVERHLLKALAIDTGTVLWQTPVPEPVGAPVLLELPATSGAAFDADAAIERAAMLPVRGQRLLLVRWRDGAELAVSSRRSDLAGQLMTADGLLVAQTPERIVAWSLPGREQAASEPPALTSIGDLKAVIERAAADRTSGWLESSERSLRALLVRPEIAAFRDAIQRELARTLLARLQELRDPAEAPRVEPLLTEQLALHRTDDLSSRIAALQAGFHAARRTGQTELAARCGLQLLELNSEVDHLTDEPGPVRIVRHNRLMQGELLSLSNPATPASADPLTTLLNEMIRQAETSRDPFAIQKAAARLHPFPQAASLVLRDEARIGASFVHTQLQLLELAGRSDPIVAGAAAERLARLYVSRSYDRDAAALRTRFPDMTVPPAAATDPPQRDRRWPETVPKLTEKPAPSEDVSFVPVPVSAAPGSLFQRLNVAVNGRSIVRFYGDGNAGYWQIALPKSSSPFRALPMLARGWGLGHFLLLRLGSELFALNPFDPGGEPRATLLWTFDTADGVALSRPQFDLAQPGFSIDEISFLDAFDQPIGRVGPVRAGYLCFQSRARLVCLETATGHELWRRYELPRDAICCGDEEHVFLIHPREATVTVLRALDGRTLATHVLPRVSTPVKSTATNAAVEQPSAAGPLPPVVLFAEGSQALLGIPRDDEARSALTHLIHLDLRSAQPLWNRMLPEGEQPLMIGSEWLGLLNAAGRLEILRVETGATVITQTVQRPLQIQTLAASSDAGTHLIALSQRSELPFQAPGQLRGGYRNPALDGVLLCLHAQTGALLWQRSLTDTRFPLDQPKDLPLVVLSQRRVAPAPNTPGEAELRLIDRRTGADIATVRSALNEDEFAIEPDASQRAITLRQQRRVLRLEY